VTDAAYPSGLACPGCVAAPAAVAAATRPSRADLPLRRVEISLPAIHCAACITGVEAGLAAHPEVRAARVNLTLKRVAVTAEDSPGVERRLIDHLTRLGFEARPLDSAALEATRVDAAGRDLLARIAVAGFALMNVMLLSVSVWTGAADTTRDLMHWISALIAIPAVAFAALPFFRNAWTALKAGRLDMDVPISTAILLAVGVSLYETMHSGKHAFFDAALMLTFFLLIGRYLAHLTRASARSAAAELAALEVHYVTRLDPDGASDTVPLDAVREGDLLHVLPGGRIPVDGTVTDGRSEIDPSMLTGETMPEAVAPGSLVRAGMTNLSGPLTLRADRLGDDTLLREIARLVEAAEQSRTRYASLADRASQYYSHIVNVLAITAFLGWGFIAGDWRLATNIAAAVLIITCPCALGLAVPSVLTAASGRLFRKGVLLKDGTAFEKLAEVDTVVFDKTGTLTTGRPVLLNAASLPPDTFAVAAALARASAHPLARAIAEAHDGAPAPVADIVEHPGLGTEGRLGDRPVRLGRAEWVGAEGDPEHTATWIGIDGEIRPLFFTDELRPEAPATIAALREAGLRVELLSGDAARPVAALARRLGIETHIARATPRSKVDRLEALRREGRKVLMVGDGLNDAAALAAAHVSISPASAVDATRSTADLIVLGNRLDRIPEALALARTARRRVLENFAMAFGYNVITVPIAYAGFVTPLIAAIAMSGSSIVVALNALRLGAPARRDREPEGAPGDPSPVPAE
jgi:P-type Cu2+ transporter